MLFTDLGVEEKDNLQKQSRLVTKGGIFFYLRISEILQSLNL